MKFNQQQINLSHLITKSLQPLFIRLESLPTQEQTLVKLLGIFLLVSLFWYFLVSLPLNTHLKSIRQSQKIERQWAELQGVQAELQSLKTITPLSLSQSQSAVQELVIPLGPSIKMNVQNSMVRIELIGLSPESFYQLMSQIRTRSQAQITQASIMLDPSTKLWGGSLTLELPQNPDVSVSR
jgi:type II secretory pathway component PulM